MVKNLPAMQETQAQSLGQEDPLEKGMAIHSSILAWRIPWTEEPGGLQSMGSAQRVRHDQATNAFTFCASHFTEMVSDIALSPKYLLIPPKSLHLRLYHPTPTSHTPTLPKQLK